MVEKIKEDNMAIDTSSYNQQPQQNTNPVEIAIQAARLKQQMQHPPQGNRPAMAQPPAYGSGTGSVLPSLGGGQPYGSAQPNFPSQPMNAMSQDAGAQGAPNAS